MQNIMKRDQKDKQKTSQDYDKLAFEYKRLTKDNEELKLALF
jgi:hypothetical protein